jgi:hypothetical protein
MVETDDIGDFGRHVQTTNGYAGACLIAHQVLNQSMVGGTFNRDTLVPIGNLIRQLVPSVGPQKLGLKNVPHCRGSNSLFQ